MFRTRDYKQLEKFSEEIYEVIKKEDKTEEDKLFMQQIKDNEEYYNDQYKTTKKIIQQLKYPLKAITEKEHIDLETYAKRLQKSIKTMGYLFKDSPKSVKTLDEYLYYYETYLMYLRSLLDSIKEMQKK